jgi:DNA primase
VLGQGEPKYLNSPESPIFTKGRMLYGLNWARNAIRRDDRVLLVEGYFDVLRCVAGGIESVVAPLGTALTADQAALLTRYTKNIYLLYDSDGAGQRATFRAGDALLAKGASVQVVTLPDGDDPDSFVAKNGARGLEAQIASSVDVFDRKVQVLERAGYFATLRQKRKALDHLLPTIRAAADPLTQDLYIQRAAEAAGVGRDLLANEVAGEIATRFPLSDAPAGEADFGPPSGPTPPPERQRPFTAAAHLIEKTVVRALLHHRHQVDWVCERIGPDDFRDRRYRHIFGALGRLGRDATIEGLARELDPVSQEELERLLAERGGLEDLAGVLRDSVAQLQARPIKVRLREIDREYALTQRSEEKDSLTREKQDLQAELQALGVAPWKSFRSS